MQTGPGSGPSLNLSPRSQEPRGSQPEALVSPSVLLSRTPTKNRRQSMLPASGRGFSEAAVAAAAARRSSMAVGGASASAAGAAGAAAAAAAGMGGIDEAGSPLSFSSGRSSDSPSPERSTPSAARFAKQHPQQQYKKKQPLLLHRAKWQQQAQRAGARPAPSRLAAAAAAARASVGGAAGAAATGPAASPGEDGEDGDAAAAAAAATDSPTADAVAAAALGADRAAGARAMRGALEELRGERDSLANACGRLEADREAASVQLREGGELVRKLTEARETLEADKSALEERCAALRAEVEACGKGECAAAKEAGGEGGARDVLRARFAELEKERDETAELVSAHEEDIALFRLVVCYLAFFVWVFVRSCQTSDGAHPRDAPMCPTRNVCC